MKNAECNERKDPVERMVHDLSAEQMVEWLIEYHGLDKFSAETVEMNLREQFRWHRLQGRLDRDDLAATMAELLNMRQSPLLLESPHRKAEEENEAQRENRS